MRTRPCSLLALLLPAATAGCIEFSDRGPSAGATAPPDDGGCELDPDCEAPAICFEGACCTQSCTDAAPGTLSCGLPCPTELPPHWVLLGPDGDGCDGVRWPTARGGHALAERDDGTVVLFGGAAGAEEEGLRVPNDELWTLRDEGDSIAWLRHPRPEGAEGAWPAARWGHALVSLGPTVCEAHQKAPGCVLLFGGRSDAQTVLSDAWLWDEQSGFSALPGDHPTARELLGATREFVGGDEALLFGGLAADPPRHDDPSLGLDEVWRFGASGFVAVPRGPGESWALPRGRHGLALHPGRGGPVVYGGTTGAGRDGLTDAHRWTGRSFSELGGEASAAPGPIGDFAFAYDRAVDRLVLFGGSSTGGLVSAYFGEKTAFHFELPSDGTWMRATTDSTPGARDELAGAWLGDEGVVIFGGCVEPRGTGCTVATCELLLLRR